MALQQIRNRGAAAVAVVGLGAMLAGCARDGAGAASFAAAAAGAPVAVSCEPSQRAVVRQVASVTGVQSQVQCESVAPAIVNGSAAGFAAAPVAYQPGFQPVAYTGGYAPIAPTDNARIVRTASPQAIATRPAAPRRTAYQPASERVYKAKRSVTKSAVIIGSSAGVGAGVGAVIGGKKGAGIGVLLGGGGAALWDQITRRR
jgi:hypothetical protein